MQTSGRGGSQVKRHTHTYTPAGTPAHTLTQTQGEREVHTHEKAIKLLRLKARPGFGCLFTMYFAINFHFARLRFFLANCPRPLCSVLLLVQSDEATDMHVNILKARRVRRHQQQQQRLKLAMALQMQIGRGNS